MFIHLFLVLPSFYLKKIALLLSIGLMAGQGADVGDPEKNLMRRIKWRSSNEAFVVIWRFAVS
jgi:hypothetical protein